MHLDSRYIKPFILLLLLLSVATASNGQVISDTLANGIVVENDLRYGVLAAKRAEINKKATAVRNVPKRGFRIQVLNTTDRNEALNTKSRLLSLYPDHRTYLMYQAPYFKLRIGNFIERKDADELRKELNRLFPSGVFVIPSEIEVKPAPEELR